MVNLPTLLQAATAIGAGDSHVPTITGRDVMGNHSNSPFVFPEQSQGSFPALLKFGKTEKKWKEKALQLRKKGKKKKKSNLLYIWFPA